MNEEGLQHIRWGSSFCDFCLKNSLKTLKMPGQKVARKWAESGQKVARCGQKEAVLSFYASTVVKSGQKWGLLATYWPKSGHFF